MSRRRDPDRPRHSLFKRFDDFVMKFVGPADRSPADLRGNEQMSEQTQQWYSNLQSEYEMVKDAHGQSYLRRRGS
ncbi:MAG: hypothetical protein Q4C90_00995 [Kocuria sp.]|uniref:Uncharacterized protein n=1 Tax=Kocuria salsicia TaxID=664639 RepID=A0ABV3KE49_9MICC|nr:MULTISPECIES: hypothetical protein [Kocuria]MBS6029153.1 hypothetical protein [Kocuria rhizophila]MDO4255743.1 hypothetical protein [Kocuria sp.]